MDSKKYYSAIVLAAGLSKRMGKSNKMLLDINGKPMLAHVVDALVESVFDEILVVLGHEASVVEKIIPHHPKIRPVYNTQFALGMSTSISFGVTQIDDRSTHCGIVLGDMPYLQAEDYNHVIAADLVGPGRAGIIIPIYQTHQGHPVIFSKALFGDLATLPVNDQGAKSVIQKHPNAIHFVSFGHDRILRDIDQRN